jgi:hypothetical protein
VLRFTTSTTLRHKALQEYMDYCTCGVQPICIPAKLGVWRWRREAEWTTTETPPLSLESILETNQLDRRHLVRPTVRRTTTLCSDERSRLSYLCDIQGPCTRQPTSALKQHGSRRPGALASRRPKLAARALCGTLNPLCRTITPLFCSEPDRRGLANCILCCVCPNNRVTKSSRSY